MSKNSKFITKINRLPLGTTLKREAYGKHRSFRWVGFIDLADERQIGPIRNPNLGTVVERLLILKRRREQDEERAN